MQINYRLEEVIRQFINTWNETVRGEAVKNMVDNGSSYESICDAMEIDYADYEEE